MRCTYGNWEWNILPLAEGAYTWCTPEKIAIDTLNSIFYLLKSGFSCSHQMHRVITSQLGIRKGQQLLLQNIKIGGFRHHDCLHLWLVWTSPKSLSSSCPTNPSTRDQNGVFARPYPYQSFFQNMSLQAHRERIICQLQIPVYPKNQEFPVTEMTGNQIEIEWKHLFFSGGR